MSLEKKIDSLVRKALYEFDLLGLKSSMPNQEEPVKIAVALSGGKDSITMLQMLLRISGRGFPPFELFPIYVAGEFSCGPGITEGYLKNLCCEWGLNLEVAESTQTLDTLECYSCSRERRSLIFSRAKKLGAKLIAFGHHKDDMIETLLLNLLHKAEFAAMLPKVDMRFYEIDIIRPLYFVSEAEIASYAQKEGFARITCQCPVGQKSKRKEVKTILSRLEDSFPNVKENLFLSGLKSGSKKANNAPRSPLKRDLFQIFTAN